MERPDGFRRQNRPLSDAEAEDYEKKAAQGTAMTRMASPTAR